MTPGEEFIVEDGARQFVYGPIEPMHPDAAESPKFLLTNLRKIRTATEEDVARLPKFRDYLARFQL